MVCLSSITKDCSCHFNEFAYEYFMADVPDSALILRRHGLGSNLFSCLVFNELEAFNPRDQLAFAFVRDKMKPEVKINMFEVEVLEQVAVEYRHNLRSSGGTTFKKVSSSGRTKRAHPDLLYVNGSCCSKCQKYLSIMWGDTSNDEGPH